MGSDQQLWLFPQPRPLRERLGNDFFRQVPRTPGVYLMLDRDQRVVYVVINTRPEAYGFIGLRGSEEQLELWLTQEMTVADELYGAFKGARWFAYRALLRLLVWALNPTRPMEELPVHLLGPKPPRRARFQLGHSILGTESRRFLEGLRGVPRPAPIPVGSESAW